ncbi:MAG: heparinase II/III family protein [Clostridia bacterium]|nr:heparinase II/III family protein [Clostridia bacterium]
MKHNFLGDLLRHTGAKVHPRIFLTASDFDRIRTSDDPIYAAGRANVIKKADELMGKPLLEYNIPDGIRLLAVSRATLARSLNLGFAYQITQDTKYAERLWLELENVASYKDWNPYHHLDVGEMCNAVAIGYDWIYDYLTEGQRAVLRAALQKNGFEATMDDYLDRERRRSYRWYQDDPGDNWKFVCNGGATVALLAICDEDDVDTSLLEAVFEYAFEDTYRAVRTMYYPDGSYIEGFIYWNYASDYLGHYVWALKTALGTDYGLCDYEPVRTSAYYVKRLCSNSFRAFNFGDAAESVMAVPVLSWMGRYFNDPVISTMRADYLRENLSLVEPYDLIWYLPCEAKYPETVPLGFGRVGGDNASFRVGFGEDDLYAAIHFGENDAYHGHADTGTFVIEWKKRRFICDLGADNYNIHYHHAYRYRAEGHNALVFNPSDGPDQNIKAYTRIERFSNGEQGEMFAIADTSDVYFGRPVKRGIRITEVDGLKWVSVRDEYKLKKGEVGLWFAHTTGDIELSEDGGSAIITIDGQKMLVICTTGLCFEVWDCKLMCEAHNQEGQYDNSKFRKLVLRLDPRDKAVEVVFRPFSYDGNGTYMPSPKPLCEW